MEMINNYGMLFFLSLILIYLIYVVIDIVKGFFEERKVITYDIIHECWYYKLDKIDNITICKPVKKVCSSYILVDQKCVGLQTFNQIKDEKLIEKQPKYKKAFMDSTMYGLDCIDDDWQEHYDGYMYITNYVVK